MKKIFALILALVMALSLVACGGGSDEGKGDNSDVKIGVVLVGDENEGYTAAHINGIKAAAEKLGIAADQIIWKYNIGENEVCYDTCTQLVDEGCVAVFTNSYGHQSHAQQAASENSDVQFVSVTGDTAAVSGLDNFSNAFNKIYESRYVSGVVAGMKLAELDKNGEIPASGKDADGNVKVGYVGAYPYAEVVSGYTAFYLGIKSVYENVVMEVQYTNAWFDLTKEAEAAKAMISDGCVIIGQHADSTGAPSACEEALKAGTVVYSVGYNIDMLSVAPTAALTSATNNWEVYYEYAFSQLLKGEKIDTNWAEGYDAGAVAITELGKSCAEGTADKVAEVEGALKDGSLHVFDCANFTVDGKNLDSAMSNVEPDDKFEADTEAIADGYFHESEFRSAPYFELRIDGISELNNG